MPPKDKKLLCKYKRGARLVCDFEYSQKRVYEEKLLQTKPRMDFLGIQGYHVLITGAAGAIGQETVKEFLGKAGFFAIMSRIP
jgi:hypothetical protein